MGLLRRTVARLGRSSQQAACRNALAATTVLERRSRERREVEDFLARHRTAHDAADLDRRIG